MQGFIVCVLVLYFISPCLCIRFNVRTTSDTTYNVMQYGATGDGKSDDTKAFSSAWSNACKAEGKTTLVIPSGKSFLVKKVDFIGPCNAEILIQFEGKIVAPSKDAWEARPYLIEIDSVNGLTIDGNNVGEIDGNGATWWDCSDCKRPGVFHFHKCDKLNVSNLAISNSPRSHVSVNECNGATISKISIDAPDSSPNTDGIDVSDSINILIQDSNIKSGDDCIAINGGTSFLDAKRITCGPGHGISVGSLGKDGASDQVSNIYVQNCTFKETTNGARIKTFPGGSGYAKNITYEQIILENVKNPIIIDQEYNNYLQETSVSVSSVTFRGFSGTYTGKVAINLDCKNDASVICKNAHGKATDTIPNVPCLSN
ncbi:probable polygalacturonase At3g15720 [Vicia villosa]|uniref:probable polygalacturonase At3g15720 n=1 Tax=Vicia villosa TaxID=3911 RepID=UPI00273CB200|nr:probable polygalacturonase At3g15720 [Vicia villosa]